MRMAFTSLAEWMAQKSPNFIFTTRMVGTQEVSYGVKRDRSDQILRSAPT